MFISIHLAITSITQVINTELYGILDSTGFELNITKRSLKMKVGGGVHLHWLVAALQTFVHFPRSLKIVFLEFVFIK